ncbi:TPA: hypothetical protein LAL11_001333 [Escherichia coli]|nr:hypothetical protein [Escherichia coli]HBY0248188.1 hypothetical protein [Klebsiella pneumoniae]EEU9135731.1 hypothetical protein [Escherichia coli]EFB9180120.1 hypothetical protein [Escherichia coli]EFE8600059.1 hypothetical protein [Escherichia coli]EFH7426807.1 hypothetical protein [Escherichia coli]
MQACGEDGPKSVADKFAELEARCAALAAENAGLKHAMAVTLEHVSVTDAGQAGVAAMIINDALHHSETPATDAFLAEVRAQAFNDLCSVFVKDATVAGLDDGDIVTVKEATDALLHCAEQIRKGGSQ